MKKILLMGVVTLIPMMAQAKWNPIPDIPFNHIIVEYGDKYRSYSDTIVTWLRFNVNGGKNSVGGTTALTEIYANCSSFEYSYIYRSTQDYGQNKSTEKMELSAPAIANDTDLMYYALKEVCSKRNVQLACPIPKEDLNYSPNNEAKDILLNELQVLRNKVVEGLNLTWN